MMKRAWWCLKVGFLCMALFALCAGYTSPATAQDDLVLEGGGGGAICGLPCEQSSTNQCFCVGGAVCQGCFLANGTGGCGVCAYRAP